MDRSKTILGVCAALAAVPLLGSVGSGSAAAGPRQAAARGTWTPPDDTIVSVRGSGRSGFSVTHADGSTWHLPTRSEAWAECSGYHRRVRQVRCATEVRIWYRDLGELRRSLRYARQPL
jgi:hypothetical protein